MHYIFDSRQCALGDTFIALKGEKVDGHLYLETAAKKGARTAIVSKEYKGDSFGLELVRVDDPLLEIQKRARQSITERGAFVVGITGSVGKTTTKEFISEILGRYYRVAKTPGNANSQISMPVSILNADPKAEVFVLEMGASEPGNLDTLTSIAPPDFAVLTHISHSHTEFFGGLEGVAREKKKIFNNPNLKWGAASVQTIHKKVQELANGTASARDLNKDLSRFSNPPPIGDRLGGEKFKDRDAGAASCQLLNHFVYNIKSDKIATYGLNGDYEIMRVGEGFQIRLYSDYSPIFKLSFTADHLIEDFLGAFAICSKIGLTPEQILAVAPALKPYSHRFEKIEKGGVVFIDDSYNASVASFLAAFKALPSTKGRRIGVIGEMREMGDFLKEAHHIVAKEALNIFDEVLCIGEECAPIFKLFKENNLPAALFESKTELKNALFNTVREGDLVLLKGANSFKLWEMVEDASFLD